MYNEDKFIEEFTNSIDDGWMGCLDSVTGAGTPRVWSAIWFLDPQRNGTLAREEGGGGGGGWGVGWISQRQFSYLFSDNLFWSN